MARHFGIRSSASGFSSPPHDRPNWDGSDHPLFIQGEFDERELGAFVFAGLCCASPLMIFGISYLVIVLLA